MIQITPKIAINEADFQFEFIQAGGPGGQNVNKVATAVQLRYNIEQANLPDEVRARLKKLAGNRLTADGVLIIQARRYRRQEKNRQDAVDRLVKLIKQAAKPPKPRRPTRPSRAARARRIENKRRHSQKKRLRRSINKDESI